MYDAGLYDPNGDEEEEDESFVGFLQEMVSIMADVEREEKVYSMDELQQMFVEMAQVFEDCSQWYGGATSFFQVEDEHENLRDCSRHLKKTARLDSPKPMVKRESYVHASSLQTFGRTGFVN